MYASYFGLKQEPFSIAPDPRLLFMSERHREALAHLLYGVQGGGGFVLLTGEIGTGKTTVCRSFLEQVPPHVNLAYIFNPKLTVPELLDTVCHEFGIAVPRRDQLSATVKDYLDPLNAFLLASHAQGRNNVLVIDEAQNLSADVLEQLRLLTNLETNERKLLQIILIGQPELREMLARPELEQLAQRVIARYHLAPLDAKETAQYVRYRMEAAGLERPFPFENRALARIHKRTGGVPRRINLLCDRALLGAYAAGQGTVTARTVDQAAREVFGTQARTRSAWLRPALAMGLGLAVGAGILATATRAVDDAEAQRLQAEQVAALAAAPRPPAGPVLPPVPPRAALRPVADMDAAWRELAQEWGVQADANAAPCRALDESELRCFSRKLPLALVRQLDRPGVITLDANSTQPTYAVLLGLGETSALLRANGTEHRVPLAALAERWQGEFATLWRGPRAGEAAALRWTAQQLAKIKGSAAPVRAARLDDALRSEIRAFQVAQGLPADGYPGPMTFMQINRATAVDEPRLRNVP